MTCDSSVDDVRLKYLQNTWIVRHHAYSHTSTYVQSYVNMRRVIRQHAYSHTSSCVQSWITAFYEQLQAANVICTTQLHRNRCHTDSRALACAYHRNAKRGALGTSFVARYAIELSRVRIIGSKNRGLGYCCHGTLLLGFAPVGGLLII